jgi:hypothetical protein
MAVYEIKMTLDALARQRSRTVQNIRLVLHPQSRRCRRVSRRIADRTRMTRAWSVFLARYPLVLSRSSYGRRSVGLRRGSDERARSIRGAIYSVGVNYPASGRCSTAG